MSNIQADRAFAALRDEILACRQPPASKLKIQPICARFEVSPGAAREALSRLVADGLVRNEPQKGFFVAPVSLKELQDLTEVRIQIETLCLSEAIASGGLEWEAGIVAALHRLDRIAPRRPGHPDELNPVWSAAHAAYHAALVSACGNAVLMRLRAMLYFESERYRHWCLPLVAGVRRDVAGEHKALVDAVLARDAAAVGRLMRDHLQRTTDILATSSVIGAGETAGGVADVPGEVRDGTGRRATRSGR